MFLTVVLEKTLESPLDCKEIQPVHSKGDQSWIFIARTDVEAEAPILWPPDAKNWLIVNTLMLGKIEIRRRGQQWMIWLDGITDSMDTSLGKLQELMKDKKALRTAVHVVAKSQRKLRDWTELNLIPLVPVFVFMSIQGSFDYCCFAVRIQIRKYETSYFVLLFYYYFDNSGFIEIPYKF